MFFPQGLDLIYIIFKQIHTITLFANILIVENIAI